MYPLGILPAPRLHPEAPGEARAGGWCRGPGQLHEGGCRRALRQGRGEEHAQSVRKVSGTPSSHSSCARKGSFMARARRAGLLRRPEFLELGQGPVSPQGLAPGPGLEDRLTGDGRTRGRSHRGTQDAPKLDIFFSHKGLPI